MVFLVKSGEEQKLTGAVKVPIYNEHGKLIPNFVGIADADDNDKVFKIATDKYALVQHSDVRNVTVNAMEKLGIKHDLVRTTDTGKRMYLEFDLPTIKHDVGKSVGDIVNLRVGIGNSYDCTSGVRLDVYGHRLVCSNGMWVNQAFGSFYGRHAYGVDLDEITKQIKHAILIFEKDFCGLMEKYVEEPFDQYRAVEFVNSCKEAKILPVRTMDAIAGLVEHRNGADTGELKTKWDLYNSITEAITHDNTNIFMQRDRIRKIVKRLDQYSFAA